MAGEKLIIKYTEGCMSDSLTINDKESIDMSLNEIKEVFNKVLDKLTSKEYCSIEKNAVGIIQNILIDLAETHGDYEDLGTCEQCGDSIVEYTLKV